MTLQRIAVPSDCQRFRHKSDETILNYSCSILGVRKPAGFGDPSVVDFCEGIEPGNGGSEGTE
jgi:hypothetical protein